MSEYIFKSIITELVLKNTVALSVEAKSQRDEQDSIKRGVFMVGYKSIKSAMSKGKVAMPWISYDHLIELEIKDQFPSEMHRMLSTYDPKLHFLVFISIGVSKTRFKKGEDDAVTRIFGVPYATPDEVDIGIQSTPVGSSDDIMQLFEAKTCSHCGKSPVNLMVCSRCKCVRYCNRSCQTKNWAKVHKNTCHILKDVKRNVKYELTGR